MPFIRLGKSDGAAPIYNKSATLGFIYKFHYQSDLAGFAVNWGEIPDELIGVATNQEQITSELFWRIQFARNLAFTPNIQYLQDPALNPVDDSVLSMGLRARFTF